MENWSILDAESRTNRIDKKYTFLKWEKSWTFALTRFTLKVHRTFKTKMYPLKLLHYKDTKYTANISKGIQAKEVSHL